MVNNRVFYAIEQLAFKDNAADPTNEVAIWNARYFPPGVMATGVNHVWGKWEVPRGVQSVGMTTTFNTEEVFELGQVEVYEQSERQPDVEWTVSKMLDGTKPLWFMVAEPSGSNNNLVGKTANFRVDAMLNIFPDTSYRAGPAEPLSACLGSGMYLTGVTYTFPVDGFVSEEVTLMGNDKIWASFDATLANQDEATLSYPPGFGEFEAPVGVPSGVFGWINIGGAQESAGGSASAGIIVVGSGIQRREEVDLSRSVLPTDIPGVGAFSTSGLVAAYIGGELYHYTGDRTILVGDCNCDSIAEHLQSITCNVDLSRTDIFELGSKRPFVKVVDFPVEVTASIEAITSNGDLVDARSLDYADNTSPNNTIIIRTKSGFQLDLGDSNRLIGVDVGGGEAGGDNLTTTYNYQSFGTWNCTHDTFNPNHRIFIFATGNSRFNQGFAIPYTRDTFGIW